MISDSEDRITIINYSFEFQYNAESEFVGSDYHVNKLILELYIEVE